MGPTQKDPEPRRKLGETLAGHLTARARGLLASEFVLSYGQGIQIGRLDVHGLAGAELEAGKIEAHIERVGRADYRMISSGLEVLTSTGDATSPRITSNNHPYETSLYLLHNRAEAGPAGHHPTIHIKGGFTNRNYELLLETDDENSLPVALFLLYRLVSLRREAYRA